MPRKGSDDDQTIEELIKSDPRKVANWGGGGDGDREDGEISDSAADMDASFVFDTHADETEDQQQPSAPDTPAQQDGLFLPSHVQIVPEALKDEPTQVEDGELGDFLQLDADPTTAGRYYLAEESAERKRAEVCPACGEEGHGRKQCPHQHCLACGAMDEHSTRNCPLGTSCFRCGGQGHRSRECNQPRRGTAFRDCERCGSYNHSKTTCPTLWRLYVYDDAGLVKRRRAIKARKAKEKRRSTISCLDVDGEEASEVSDSSSSGEASTPPGSWDPADRWCYNCSTPSNHWGDDCPERRCNPTPNNGEPSAFSEFVSRWGPYASAMPKPPPLAGYGVPSRNFDFSVGSGTTMHLSTDHFDPPKTKRQKRREAEKEASKKKKKEKKAQNKEKDDDGEEWKKVQDAAAEEEDDDWFASHTKRNVEKRSAPSEPESKGRKKSSGPPKSKAAKGGPSLLGRMEARKGGGSMYRGSY